MQSPLTQNVQTMAGQRKNLRSHLCQTSLVFSMMLISAHASAGNCVLQTTPVEVKAEELLSGYLHVALDSTACISAGKLEYGCNDHISRKRSNFYFGILGIELLSENASQAIAEQINLTHSEIKEVTGIQGYAKPKLENDSVVALVFIDSAEAKKDPATYIDSNLKMLGLGSADALTPILLAFLSEESLGCLTLNREGSAGNILISSTWVDSSLATSDINQCVARAFVGGMGLVAEDMVKEGKSAKIHRESDILFSLPDDYKLYLELHYSGLVKSDMTHDQIERDENILSALGCK